MYMKMKNFVMIPREIKDAYVDGKLTLKQFWMLMWIFLNTNPVNGRYETSYRGLAEDFDKIISYDNARQIISFLRKNNWIEFPNHRGRGGKFTIRPSHFQLTNGSIQTPRRLPNTTKSELTDDSETLPTTGLENNYIGSQYKFKNGKEQLGQHFSMGETQARNTTAYNDTDNKKDTIIDINKFTPKRSEEQRCLDIARELGEHDMRFVLSSLKKHGIHAIERAAALTREAIQAGGIINPAAYFNKVINKPPDDTS